ncbi:MAG: pentapeptide repeat-containing protein [Cyanobacteria bacterium P01_G01_bin.39]
MSEKPIIVKGNYYNYNQSGNFGAGHVSESEIKGQAKLGGTLNEAKESTDSTQQSIESKKTIEYKKEAKHLYKIVIEGKVTEIDYLTIEKIRQKCSEFNLKNEKTKLTSKWRIVWETVNQDANGKDLSGEDLSNAYLRYRYTSFVEARLVKAKLNGSQLNYANLARANLIGADLSNTELLNANLTDADLSGCIVDNARFGYNEGISDVMKSELELRGAIFEDSPPDKSPKVYSPTPSPVK